MIIIEPVLLAVAVFSGVAAGGTVWLWPLVGWWVIPLMVLGTPFALFAMLLLVVLAVEGCGRFHGRKAADGAPDPSQVR